MTAFSSGSLRTGAVVSFHGDRLVASGADIVQAARSQLIDGALKHRDQWLTHDVPVLSRADAWIIPLFFVPEASTLDEAGRQLLDSRASELGQSIMSACRYEHGEPLSVDFDRHDGPAVYAAELARTGATDGAWWAVGDFAIVLVYYRAHVGAPKQRMALHVVPVGWVSVHHPTKAKKMPNLDLAWNWADVVNVRWSDDQVI